MTPACRTAVPREFHDENELDRGSESELAARDGKKLMLELSSVTKFGLDGASMVSKLGLDGAPICSILGLE